MVTKIEAKFIELFVDIVENDRIIPYTDDMELTVVSSTGFKMYIDPWNAYVGIKKRSMGDEFDAWFDSLTETDQLTSPFLDTLPSKNIRVVWNNNIQLASKLHIALERYVDRVKAYCYPLAKDSSIEAGYETNTAGFYAYYDSYNPADKKYKKPVTDIMNELRKEVDSAIDAFNDAQEPDGIFIGHSIYHNSAEFASDDDRDDIQRGHVASNRTVFEGYLTVDEERLFRKGKGSSISSREVMEFFKAFKDKEVSVGNTKAAALV